ncbi:hypothetical protein [Actinoplanes sp. NPDC026670]|uniref:hypothetical protein n=1 Tax=Actinoplanes sp. NPDC026670 TaxID=3154700 RepID=UPI0033BFBDC2
MSSDAFLALVAAGTDPAEAAVSACVAAGSSHAEAVRRLREFDGMWTELEPAEIAMVLETLHYFEPDAVLGEQDQAAVTSMRAAIKATPGIPSGAAQTLFTYFRTGRVTDAFDLLEGMGRSRWADNAAFWAAMDEAAGILGMESDQTRRAR